MSRVPIGRIHRDWSTRKLLANVAEEFPVLTAEEEVQLAMDTEAGVFAAQKIKQVEESGEEFPDLEDYKLLAKQGEESKGRLFLSNLSLVAHFAGRVIIGHPKQDFRDIFANGQIGLGEAVNRFDYKRGFKFSTYAGWWIKNAMIDRGRDEILYLSALDRARLSKIEQERDKFYRKHLYYPCNEVVAESASIKPRDVSLLRGATHVDFLNEVVPDTQEELGSFIYDPNDNPLDEIVDRVSLEQAMSKLNSEQLYVIRKVWFESDEQQKLKKIAKQMGVSPNTLSAIHASAKNKLRDILQADDVIN